MSRRKRATTRAVGAAGLDQLLDQLEDGILGGDRAAAEAALPQLLDERADTPDVLTRRLITGRSRVPGYLFELLAGLTGPGVDTYLARIAEAREADGLLRFGARRRLGWPEQGEARERLAFLETLADADETLLRATAQAAAGWPQNAETYEEVLGYLTAMPARRRLALAARIAEHGEAPRPWLLRALLHAKDKGTQRLAIQALSQGDDQGAADALDRLARTTGDARLRAEAADAAARARAGAAVPQPLPPIDQALLSMLDGEGAQVALVVRQIGEGVCLFANILHNEQVGVKGASGAAWLAQDEAEAMIEQMEDSGIAMIAVPLAALRGVLAGALAINAAAGQGLPAAYELWAPLTHDSYPPAPDEPIVEVALDDAPYAGRADLVARGDSLAAHPFFQHWGFDYADTSAALHHALGPAGNALSERDLTLLAETLATPGRCARFRARLRRQAWLLDHLGDTVTRDLALAAAAAFASADRAAIVAMPFLRAMVADSVQHLMFGPYAPDIPR